MKTPKPSGFKLQSYSERPHTPKSYRRFLRDKAMPRDKGAANRTGPVNVFGQQRPKTPLDAARVYVQVKGLKAAKGYTYHQMITQVSTLFVGLGKRDLVNASLWRSVKSVKGKQNIVRDKSRKTAKPQKRTIGAYLSTGMKPMCAKDVLFEERLERIRAEDHRNVGGRILTRRERR